MLDGPFDLGLPGPFGGGDWLPANLFTSGSLGVSYDTFRLDKMFQDSLGATAVIGDGDPIGMLVDQSGNGVDAIQATASMRYSYEQDDSGYAFAAADDVDDVLVATVPDLGADATTATLHKGEIQIIEGQTIGAGALNLPTSDFRAHLAIDRDLTYSEMNQLIRHWSKHSDVSYGVIKNRVDVIMLNAVDAKVYDTSKDSDGGAWRTGALALASSYYNETLNTATRGATQAFPAIAVIVAEAAKVTIYDGDDPSLPMWRVSEPWTAPNLKGYWRTFRDATAVEAENGLVAWTTGVSASGLSFLNFASDQFGRYSHSTIYSGIATGIASSETTEFVDGTLPILVDPVCNDVAMTVLSGAPIDPATGIETPTIAVATDGGVSVITDGGDVWDITSSSGASYSAASQVLFTVSDQIRVIRELANNRKVETFDIPTADVANNFWASGSDDGLSLYETGAGVTALVYGDLAFLKNTVGKVYLSQDAFGSVSGLTLISEDLAVPANSMIAYITASYNTGWMQSDIKGCWLCSTDDTDLVGTELWTTPATLDAGWTDNGDGTYTCDGSTGFLLIPSVLGVGDEYAHALTVDSLSSGQVSSPYDGASANRTYRSSVGNYAGSFKAVLTSLYIHSDGFNGTISLISTRRADEDRSVNANGLAAYGTITKTPVADGAELVAYSGFSASDYFEQPYNSDLDFGTGDFYVRGWLKDTSATAANDYALNRRDVPRAGGEIAVVVEASHKLNFAVNGNSCVSVSEVRTDEWVFICCTRVAGISTVYINGVAETTASATGDVDNALAPLFVGMASNSTSALGTGSLALWHMGASVKSAAQILKMYNDDLPRFQPKAAETLYGSSDAVTAVSHDVDTDLRHVGTSAGRSVFDGFVRKYNTVDAVASALDVSGGLVLEN